MASRAGSVEDTGSLALVRGAFQERPAGFTLDGRRRRPLLEPTPECGDDGDLVATLPQTAGPFYTPDTPERRSLLEPGMLGTRLTVTPQGQDAMESVITELDPERVYADQTVFGGLVLTFRHRLAPAPGGGTAVSHTLEITGDDADAAGPELGPQISGDFPDAMAELLAAAEQRAA